MGSVVGAAVLRGCRPPGGQHATAAQHGGTDDGSHGHDASEPPGTPRPPSTVGHAQRTHPRPAPGPRGRRRRRRSTRSPRLLGGRVGLAAVLGDLDRRARRGFAPRARGHRALTWDREDRRTTRWWPQGISTSADASATEERRRAAASWRSSVVRQAAPRRRRAPRARGSPSSTSTRAATGTSCSWCRRWPTDGTVRLAPLRVHAGGLVWCGAWLHVAATGRGLVTCHVDDLAAGARRARPGDASRLGRRRAPGVVLRLPLRAAGPFAYRASTEAGHERLRYSFLSLDRSADAAASWWWASTAAAPRPAARALRPRPRHPAARRGRRRPLAARGCSTTRRRGRRRARRSPAARTS